MGDADRNLEEQIRGVEVQIRSVEAQIQSVEQKIESVEARIETSSDHQERARLQDREARLRDKEKQLRDEKKQLRGKEVQGPGNHQSITRQQWLKQKLPPLRLAFFAPPKLRNEDILFYPESVKMWKSFGRDIADYVASLDSSDKGPFNSSVDFGGVKIYAGSNEECVRSVYEIIPIALVRFHNFSRSTIAPSQRFSASSVRAYRDNLSSASARVVENADNLDCRQFIPDWLLTFGPRHSLLIEYMKTLFFSQSNEPLPDLVSAFADYYQRGENAERKNLVLVEAVWKVYKCMSKLCIGYAVISSADATYFVRRVDGADPTYQNCMEISQAYAWSSKDPALLEALSYIMNMTAKDEKEFEFLNAESEGTPSEEDRKSQDLDVEVKDTKRPKIHRVYETRTRKTNLDLSEIAAADLHLEACRFATGWSGNIVCGRIDHHRVAVKLAPIFLVRAEALINEARAYNCLKQYWGLFLPKLISHGTTVNGQIVYIATELVSGFPIGIERVTKAVVASAFEALNAVHAFGMLHGDIREDNILVTERSVRLIDFGFLADSSSYEDYMKEREQLVDIISQFYSRIGRTDRLTGNNRIIIIP